MIIYLHTPQYRPLPIQHPSTKSIVGIVRILQNHPREIVWAIFVQHCQVVMGGVGLAYDPYLH